MAFSPHFIISLMAILLSSNPVLAHFSSTIVFPFNDTISWTNNNSSQSGVRTYKFVDGCIARVILKTKAASENYGDSLSFVFGFRCHAGISDNCPLAVMIVASSNGSITKDHSPQVVWLANRNKHAKENSTLHGRRSTGLTWLDSNHNRVWFSDTSGKLVRKMTLKENGNLVMFNSRGSVVWQSFHHPTDILLIGQALRGHRRLKSSKTHINSENGMFSLSIDSPSLKLYFRSDTDTPVAYRTLQPRGLPSNYSATLDHVSFTTGNLMFFYKEGNHYRKYSLPTSQFLPTQLLRLGPDGGLRISLWDSVKGWQELTEDIIVGADSCQLPFFCKEYGFCARRQCSCLTAPDGKNYFQPNSHSGGCSFVTPLPKNSSSVNLQLVDFGNQSYFSYFDPATAIANITQLSVCRQTCERNSSCNAAFFQYRSNVTQGLCYLISKVLTIMEEKINGLASVTSIKIPIPDSPSPPPLLPPPPLLLPPIPHSLPPPTSQPSQIARHGFSRLLSKYVILTASAVAISIVASMVILWKTKGSKWWRKDNIVEVPGIPVRFSYMDLYLATEKFATRLGRGGSGSVFKGRLKDGTEIAVKRLEVVEQGIKELSIEMKTLGSIHHTNLAKLIGFCADESNRLLVYEYMSNGSLDKWIFQDDRKKALDWATRRKIILDVAKGLTYLHEECSPRIAHLDVKPHNILLDEKFNAKVADFGLARFIDRNQSQVITGMRGTLGYMAPEWRNSQITVRADVYSFGIVILEAVCGRMNYSMEASDVFLLRLLQQKAEEDKLINIVDKQIVDWKCHEEDIVKLIKIGSWCLNDDYSKRPFMSTVVKVLEGTEELEACIDFKFAHVMFWDSQSANLS